MKKKLMIGVATVIVVAAIIGIAVFALSGGNDSEAVSLIGVWKVVSTVSNGKAAIPQNEYMVFDEKTARDFRDGDTTPYASSTYSITGTELKFPDISRTYHLAVHTDACISLYTSENTYLTIVKAQNEEILEAPFDSSEITGKWLVIYRPTEQPIQNEYLVFSGQTMADYRNNAEQPAVEAEYVWDGNTIRVPSLGIEMTGARVAEDAIVLVDGQEGYVWLLSKEVNG